MYRCLYFMLRVVSMRVMRDGHAMYQCDLPLLHPVILLLLQLFNVIWHRPSDGMHTFECGGDPRVALDLFSHVAHDGLGDSEGVAESGRHVEWWLVVMKSGGGDR